MPYNQKELEHIENIKARIGRHEFIVLIATLMATNAVAIDIMLAAMPDITHSLNSFGANDQHYIIFSYLLGFGISQIFFGPLSDRFGRRIPILLGLVFYSIASFACAFAPTFSALLVLRAIQGIGAAATRVLTVSIVRDLYGGRQMAEVMSIVMMVFMVVPVMAPAMGQLILFWFPWQWIFIFMALAGVLITIWVFVRLPETLYESRSLSFSNIVGGFKTVLSNRIALCYTLAFSVILGGLFASLNTAEQIYHGIYDLGTWFPIAFAGVAAFQALSSLFNSLFVGRFGMRRISHSLLLSFTLAALIWFLWSAFSAQGAVPFPFYMALFIVIMFSFGGLGANFNALAMEPLGKVAGTASSVFGFLQTIIGATMGFLIAQQFNGTTIPIAAGFFGLGVIAIILVLIAEKGRLFRSHGASQLHPKIEQK